MDKEKPTPENHKNAGANVKKPPKEIGGFADLGLPEPTRYGDWDVKGRCSDF